VGKGPGEETALPYVEGRVVHDADAHVFETPGWLDRYLEPALRERLGAQAASGHPRLNVDRLVAKQRDPEFRSRDAEEVMLRKGFEAQGAFIAEDRPGALDHLGFASQLVFTTAFLGPLTQLEHKDDLELAYGFARAHNRAMTEFCAVDPRLLPACFVPLADMEASKSFATETIEMGAAALMISSACPKNHSPSHIGLDPVWAAAQEAGVPVVFHVGGGTFMSSTYKKNGAAPVKDFTGGDGNFTSVSFMAIPTAPMQTLATMIIDGVLDRFPELRIGVIEQGAAWVPGWMWAMDSAADAFRKNEERLHRLSMRPSEFVRRQIRVTPYPHGPVGRIIEASAAPEVFLFSSDYPHTEGGRNPLKRFQESMTEVPLAAQEAFYRTNFEDLMGPTLARLQSAA